MYSSHIQYTPFFPCAEQGLQKILEHEARKRKWTTLFPTQELIAHIVRIMQSNETPKACLIHALADNNNAKKCHARNKLF